MTVFLTFSSSPSSSEIADFIVKIIIENGVSPKLNKYHLVTYLLQIKS